MTSFAIFAFFSIFLMETKISGSVKFSFELVLCLISIRMLIQGRFSNNYFDTITNLFFLIFMLIAPVIQISAGFFPNTFPVMDSLVIEGNAYISMFLFCNMIFSFYLYQNKRDTLIQDNYDMENSNKLNNPEKVFKIMYFIFFFSILFNIKSIYHNFTGGGPELSTIGESSLVNTLFIRCIFYFPLAPLLYYIEKYKKNGKGLRLVVLLLLIVIMIKNPFLDKRYAIGPLYISLLFYWFKDRFKTKTFFVAMFIILVMIFPFMQQFTNTSGLSTFKLKNSLFGTSFTTSFQNMDYDAFSLFLVDIDYVKRFGISYGYNLLGNILFFIPRSFWHSKPLGSGLLAGNYLIMAYNYTFNNLSNPLVGESILNFGKVGPVIFAFLYSFIGRISLRLTQAKNSYFFIGVYLATSMTYALRGDLINGISSVGGVILATVVFPKIISKMLSLVVQ